MSVDERAATAGGEPVTPEEPVALVRHDDLVAWVENELTPKLARILERQDALEAQIDLFKDESKQESDWLRKAYEELSEAVSDHTKSLEAIDHDHAQRVVDTVRAEAAKAGEVVDEKLAPIEARLAKLETKPDNPVETEHQQGG